ARRPARSARPGARPRQRRASAYGRESDVGRGAQAAARRAAGGNGARSRRRRSGRDDEPAGRGTAEEREVRGRPQGGEAEGIEARGKEADPEEAGGAKEEGVVTGAAAKEDEVPQVPARPAPRPVERADRRAVRRLRAEVAGG